MSTGLRRGELLGLRWRDIDGHRLRVQQTIVKTKDGRLLFKGAKTAKGHRIIAIPPDVVAVLEDHHRRQEAERQYLADVWPATGLVFVSEVGTAINPDNLKRLKDALMDKAGVPRATLHSLRHLHASICIKSGMNPKEVADRLGHSRASFTLDRYTQDFEAQRVSNAVSLLDFLPKPALAGGEAGALKNCGCLHRKLHRIGQKEAPGIFAGLFCCRL